MADINEPRIGDIAEVEDAVRMARTRPGRTVLFIGAGCSKSAGVPLVMDVAKRLAVRLADIKGAAKEITADPATAYRWLAGRNVRACWKGSAPAASDPVTAEMIDWTQVYDALFEDHYKTPDEVRDVFADIVGGAEGRINWAHLCVGELVKRGHVLTTITTNFDQLVLAGLVRSGILPVVCDGTPALGRVQGAPTHPQIIELHGSRHTYRLLNAPREVAALAINEQAISAIRGIFQQMGALIVVGYGGREDGVMDLMIRAAMDAPDKRLIWVAFENKTSELGEKPRRFLATSANSFVLLGQDADSFFMRLLQKLEIGAPEAILNPLLLSQANAHLLAQHDSDEIAERRIIAETITRHREEIEGLTAALRDLRRHRTATETAIAQARELQLAGKLDEAFRILEPAAQQSNARPLWRQLGEIAHSLGEKSADRGPVEKAVTIWRRLLDMTDRKSDPLEWARTQAYFGRALDELGQREDSTTNLEQAVAAYRAALTEWTRERAPLDWAMTQNNLGNTLTTLGERDSGAARLEEAVAAYRDALTEQTRERAPLDWAMTQNNLGTALLRFGEHESGTARLEEAIVAFRDALAERTRERVPLRWATTQNNLGNALQALGARESGTARLEEAVTAYRDALTERTRERAALDWATTQNNLGNALQRLGEREGGTARLEEAVTAYRDACQEYTRERVPLQWAMTQNNRGIVLTVLGERESRTVHLEEAVAACRVALEVAEAAGARYYVDMFRGNLQRAAAALAERQKTSGPSG